MAVNRQWTPEDHEKYHSFVQQIHDSYTNEEKLNFELANIAIQMNYFLTSNQTPEFGPQLCSYINAAVNALKTHQGISKQQLAQHWNLSTRRLNQYLKGTASIDVTLATKIAATFDWSPQLLVNVQLKNDQQTSSQYHLQHLLDRLAS